MNIKFIILFLLALYISFIPITLAQQPVINTFITQSHIVIPEKLIEQGESLYRTGDFQQAVTVLQQAVRIYESQKNSIRQAVALSNLALAYQQLGSLQDAKGAIDTSLNLLGWDAKLQKLKVNYQNSELMQVLAQALDIQGGIQLELGKTKLALATYEQVEKVWQQLGNNLEVTRSKINQAQAFRISGFYRRALKILQDADKNLQTQPDSPVKVAALRSLSNAWQLTGDLQRSQEVVQQSINLAQKLQLAQDISTGEFSLGNTLRIKGEFAKAIAHYQKAAEVAPNPLTKVQAQINQLSLLVEMEKTVDAKALMPMIQSQLANLPLSRSSIYAQINFARNSRSISTSENIARLLAQSWQQAQSINDRLAQSYALGCLGEVYEQNQQWQDAQKLTQKALLIAQELQAADVAYLWQWQLGRLLREQGKISDAIAYYDAAVTTLESLRSDLVGVNRDVQFNFRDSVEPIYRQSVELLFQEKAQGKPDLEKIRQRIEALQVAELDNFFREACLYNQLVVLDKFVDIDNPNTAIFYPIILKNQLNIILKLPKKTLSYKTVLVSRHELEEVLTQLRYDIVQPDKTKKVQELAQKLYNWLIQPYAADLNSSGVNTLVFIPDGSLRNIPMAVLYDGQQYLIEKYAIALSPGLQLFTSQPLKKADFNALVGGLSEVPKNEKFAPLPYVEDEVNQIQKLGIRTTTLLNENFQSEKIEKIINNQPYTIVHLATHGKFSSKATETFILAYDRRIYVRELDSLLKSRGEKRTEPIELLVLSACETAAGDNRAVLGLAGVAIKAGARSTLASLWNINDDSTTYLVSEFYRQLTTGKLSKAEALQQAQIKMLKDNNYSRPAEWSPYIIVGNWS